MYVLLMAALSIGTDLALYSEDLMHCGIVGSDVEDAVDDGLGRSDSKLGVSGDKHNTVNRVLERGNPVGNEVAVRICAAWVGEGGRVGKLAFGEGCITKVVCDAQLPPCISVCMWPTPAQSCTPLRVPSERTRY